MTSFHNPPPCMKIRITFEKQLFFSARPDMWNISEGKDDLQCRISCISGIGTEICYFTFGCGYDSSFQHIFKFCYIVTVGSGYDE